MGYFKIIVDNQIIGAISSDDFVFRTRNGSFRRTNETYAEFAEYKNQFYRTTWMVPIDYTINFIPSSILSITENEYEALKHAEESGEVIDDNIEEEEETPEVIWVDPVQQATVEYLREQKIHEMSQECKATIEAGFDLELRGETYHFSLTTQDQLNLMGLSALTQDQNLIPYHADGEAYEFYTAQEINEIIAAATALKNYNTAYFNSLKTYINTLETIEEVASITYGTTIPEEYKSDVLKVLEY